jgi:hypothetical protein
LKEKNCKLITSRYNYTYYSEAYQQNPLKRTFGVTAKAKKLSAFAKKKNESFV